MTNTEGIGIHKEPAVCHLYREVERSGDEPERGSSPFWRGRRLAAVAAGAVAAAAVAAVLWTGDTPSSEATRAAGVPVSVALARDGGDGYSHSSPVTVSPSLVEQAGLNHDDGVPTSAPAREVAGKDCSHGI